MLSTVRQIGNSRGVLIPAAFLAMCQIEDQVDMRFENGAIIIKPVKPTLRAGWFTDTVPVKSRDPAGKRGSAGLGGRASFR